MRLSAVLVATIAGAMLATGNSSVHAQSQNNQTHHVKVVAKVESKTIKVNEGDSLSSIAESNQTTFKRLFDANVKVTNPDLIYPGDELKVPAPNEQIAERELPANYVPPTPISQSAGSTTQSTQPKPSPVAAPAVQSSPVSGCGDNQYANYIYSHESGCRTTAGSPNGCYGIGQACPASKIAYCGADYDCQNAFFSSYASRYGGWEGAYNFWVSHGWW